MRLYALAPEPVHLDADLTRLAQVFSNLLTNSAKYTRQAGRISLRAALARAGHARRILLSHDSIVCWQGRPLPFANRYEDVLAMLPDEEHIAQIRPGDDGGTVGEDITFSLVVHNDATEAINVLRQSRMKSSTVSATRMAPRISRVPGRIGMMMPSASVSSKMVTKMKTTAAPRTRGSRSSAARSWGRRRGSGAGQTRGQPRARRGRDDFEQ